MLKYILFATILLIYFNNDSIESNIFDLIINPISLFIILILISNLIVEVREDIIILITLVLLILISCKNTKMFGLFNKKLFNLNNNINNYKNNFGNNTDISKQIDRKTKKIEDTLNFNLENNNKIETYTNSNLDNFYDNSINKLNNLYKDYNFCT